MLYLVSDLHGEYDLFLKLLEKIKFSNKDQMIVCGDILDKGPNSVKLAKFIFSKPNVQCILGNHEYEFLKLYWGLMKNTSDNFDEVLKELQEYFPNDGYLLDWDIVDKIESLPIYIEMDNFICVHAGLPLNEKNIPLQLSCVTVEQAVYDRYFKSPNLIPNYDKCIVFGHTPVRYLSNKDEIIFYPKVECAKKINDFSKIHLDMGTMLSGKVACLCVDTMQVYYVEKSLS